MGERLKPAAAIAAVLFAGAAITGIAAGTRLPPSAAGTAADWPNTGGSVDESGFSRLDAITTANVGRLGLASSFTLDDEVTLEATPVAVGGVVYFTGSSGAVYAVDAVSGKQVWKWDPEIWKASPLKQLMNFGANRGVAYADGRIFAGVLDGRLVALDARTGAPLWSTQTVSPTDGATVNGAPRVFDGMVIIGNGGADGPHPVRGDVTAYDQKTGKQVWRFYVTPGSPEENRGDPAMEAAAKTWTGEYWKTGGGGGTVWNGITFDPELDRIYIGTGNGGPWNPAVRSPQGGDNLYLTSIVALDAKTGKYLWHYQYNQRDAWDYKATANIIEATIPIDGKARKVLMQAPTNGFFYVIDRETGKLISAEKTGKVNWADHIDLKTGRPVEMPNIRYETGESDLWPGTIGAHNWQAMSFNPQTGLVYIPYMQLPTRYTTHVKAGEFVFGGMAPQSFVREPGDGHGALIAWDPVAQKPRWRVPIDTLWNGGTLSTAGNLVFQGTADGWFSAYDATSGKRLWRFDAGLGIVGAPMSYAVGSKQYVSVLVGYGGTTAALSDFMNVGWKYGAQPRRLLTFAIGGATKLPPSPPADMTVHALDVPSLVIDEAAVRQGQSMSIACMACHGPGFRGAGAPGPDLRESQLALNEDNFYAVVHDGALASRGMPNFGTIGMEKPQIHALWMYLRASAREALGTRRATEGKAEGARF
jgi:quinohemoprotein ethanol dehydrogenase